MKNINLYIYIGVAIFCIITILFLFTNNTLVEINDSNDIPEIMISGQKLSPEIVKASEDFKSYEIFRIKPAIILVPHLKIGMEKKEIINFLGEPNQQQESKGNLIWVYILGYSEFLDVHFDSEGKVHKIVACASGLGSDSSGNYLLEK